MKIGFTIHVGTCESMYVESSEQETLEEALSEVVELLRRVHDERVQRFVNWLLKLRIKEDDAEELAKERV